MRDQGDRAWAEAGLAGRRRDRGVGLYNKHLVVLLLVCLAGGLLIAGPRRELANKWLWAGAGIAFVIGLPNLVYQVVNGFPQAEMAAAIAEDKGGESRVMLLPLQLVIVGLPLLPVLVSGRVSRLPCTCVAGFPPHGVRCGRGCGISAETR